MALFSTVARNTKSLMQRLVFFSLLTRPALSFLPRYSHTLSNALTTVPAIATPTSTRRQDKDLVRTMMASSAAPPDITHINRAQMEEILEDYEEGGREESQYVVIDVRTEEEVYSTGKLSPNVHTLPVQVIMQANVFAMGDDEFEEYCGFEKPSPDETIVFTCAAGVRSVYACNFAAQNGYSKLVNYMGGSSEWFAPR